MLKYFLVWAIVTLGLFLLSVFCSVIRGGWSSVAIRYAASIGFIATIFYYLVEIFRRKYSL